MLLAKSFHKTKNFFQKTLRNLKEFLFGGYQKLPKAPSLNPFPSSSNDPKMHQLDNFYREFMEHCESDQDEVIQREKKSKISVKETMREDNASNESFMNYEEEYVMKNTEEERRREGNKPYLEGKNGDQVMEKKMRELEMMDIHDVDHVLDIEEILHYYSRLTCPVYLDLVDKFFMDMCSEFFLPQPSVSLNNSMQRLSPLRL